MLTIGYQHISTITLVEINKFGGVDSYPMQKIKVWTTSKPYLAFRSAHPTSDRRESSDSEHMKKKVIKISNITSCELHDGREEGEAAGHVPKQ